jgi:hypothetical protein
VIFYAAIIILAEKIAFFIKNSIDLAEKWFIFYLMKKN